MHRLPAPTLGAPIVEFRGMKHVTDFRSRPDRVDEHCLGASLEQRHRVEAGCAGVERADVRREAALLAQLPQDVQPEAVVALPEGFRSTGCARPRWSITEWKLVALSVWRKCTVQTRHASCERTTW